MQVGQDKSGMITMNQSLKSYVEKGYTAYSASGPDGFLEYFDYDK